MRNNTIDKEKLKLLCDKYGYAEEYLRLLGVPSSFRDDLLQETFIEAYTHLHQLKDMASIEPWLYKIAYRKMIKYTKKFKMKREHEQYLCAIDDQPVADDDSSDEVVLYSLNYSICKEELYEMIYELGYPSSSIILLRFKLGFKLIEIAEQLGMNYNTVKSIEHRAMGKLKHKIEERSREIAREEEAK